MVHRRLRGRIVPAGLLAASLATLLVVAAQWTGTPRDVGAVPASDHAATDDTAADDAATGDATSGDVVHGPQQPTTTSAAERAGRHTRPRVATPPAIVRRDASIAGAAAAAVPPARVPTRVRVPAAGIDVAVVRVGVEDSGAMVVPDDPRVAGWYGFGPAPGEPGSAVISAHVDTRRAGVGPFAALQELEPGSTIAIVFDDGTTSTFTVTGRRRYAKTQLPVAQLFRRDGAPVLALVTCGGAFDPVQRRYEDNVVVYAVP